MAWEDPARLNFMAQMTLNKNKSKRNIRTRRLQMKLAIPGCELWPSNIRACSRLGRPRGAVVPPGRNGSGFVGWKFEVFLVVSSPGV